MSTHGEGSGVVLTLGELRTKLSQISEGAHQWTAKLVEVSEPHEPGWTNLCAEIWYSNPGYLDLPNQISYHFPLFPDLVFGDEEDAKVCLHPGLMVPVAEGLYFEGDLLKKDWLGDFCAFWYPIREVL
jgi:hypothetical protein